MVDHLPDSFTALCLLAFVLGARHGFDADHLATIDGITRCNARSNPRLSRFCGALFSLGHGLIVGGVAVTTATLATTWQSPAWLEATGVAVSISFLFGLAYLNFRAVWLTAPQTVVAPVGLRSRMLRRFVSVRKAWGVAGVGMLFAVSFDTISQAALFALAAGRFGGVPGALLVAVLFVLGMLVVDGINGAWISRLIRRADRTALIASRVMALTVAGSSLAMGSFTVAKQALPAIDAWAEGRELLLGGAVVIGVATAFAVGMLAARHRASTTRVLA